MEKEYEETGKIPLIGTQFPKMVVNTSQGMKKLPMDYKGKWVVLFSHPADFTPVCTTEFVSFQKHYDQFKKLNVELIGLSMDQVFSHIKWIDWIKEQLDVEIKFPIIADHGEVARKLGMLHYKATNTVRAVFIIDPKGTIRAILYYPSELGRNMKEILRMIKGLKFAEEHNVAIPANWPENELIEDKVIIPPAGDVETAKDRLAHAKAGEYECFDWWFCYKKE
ncbi:MAG: peroxiredoxin [Candidatus Heimdallarchaeum endolithica]|uniref:Peroxiredoxin n=1 Tax=Candidatus Heimdallarchaeum endolithica TaxID=2876572 RepID=A0A9Y1FQ96_9ARCH|nr:MAG: peroxiredoxin [Candidatus Heimdallarchaeum endolithica]